MARIRPAVDHGDGRLHRPRGPALSEHLGRTDEGLAARGRAGPRDGKQRRRDDGHRRREDAAANAAVRPRGWHHRRPRAGRADRAAEPYLRRHGRYLVRRQPDRRRVALDLERDHAGRAAGADVGGRYPRDRGRRRLDRLGRDERPARRPAIGRFGAGARLLRARRDRTHGVGRQPRAQAAGQFQLLGGRNAARHRRRPARP